MKHKAEKNESNETKYEYDMHDRLRRIIFADGTEEKFEIYNNCYG